MKKPISFLLIFALSLGLLTGCSGSSGETAEDAAAEETAEETSEESLEEEAENEESSGGHVDTLIIGTTAANDTFNALTQTDAFGRMNYNGLTQGNFVYRDENNELQPFFWTDFTISDDGMQIDFTMPTTAVWHDGEPVTMDDMVFTLEYMRDVMEVGSLQNMSEVVVNGEDSASIIFSEPDAYYWLNSSCMNNACVYARHIWEGIDDWTIYSGDEYAIGCGPYKLVSYDTDSQTSYYEAVPENDFLGEITVDNVVLQTYSDESTLMMAMMNGEIDAMFNYANPIDADIIDTVIGTDDIDLGESPFSGNYQLEYGKYRAPGNDENFRKAVSLALDYEQLAVVINGSYGQVPGRGIITPSAKGYSSTLDTLTYNVELSKELLEESGYVDIDGDGWREMPDGSPMDVSVTPQYSSSMDLRMRIAETVMNCLDEVGIKNHIDNDSLANSEVWEANMTEGDYDLSITLTTSGMAAYSSAFRYFLGALREGESSWLWGTVVDQDVIDTYYAMTEAVSDEEYNANSLKLQEYFSDTMAAQALCWETAFFPYRTDKYTGWENFPSWGVINSRTWFNLTTK